VKFILFAILLTASPIIINLDINIQHVDSRCSNGTHKSPSGDCEKSAQNKGKPKCPNGYHRSPDGDCEKAKSGNDGLKDTSDDKTDKKSKKSNGYDKNHNSISDEKNGAGSINRNVPPTINTEYGNVSDDCLGKADCFTGVVTNVVDGDTVDVNDVRVRLALVNTAERGEAKYTEAREFVKSVCGVGTKALVDEDDGQPNGSYNRMVSLVYCGESKKSSLNQQLLQNGYAKILKQYCGVSEFSKQAWAFTYGCR
jgi:endonuclease YncB( thermonuclease family)